MLLKPIGKNQEKFCKSSFIIGSLLCSCLLLFTGCSIGNRLDRKVKLSPEQKLRRIIHKKEPGYELIEIFLEYIKSCQTAGQEFKEKIEKIKNNFTLIMGLSQYFHEKFLNANKADSGSADLADIRDAKLKTKIFYKKCRQVLLYNQEIQSALKSAEKYFNATRKFFENAQKMANHKKYFKPRHSTRVLKNFSFFTHLVNYAIVRMENDLSFAKRKASVAQMEAYYIQVALEEFCVLADCSKLRVGNRDAQNKILKQANKHVKNAKKLVQMMNDFQKENSIDGKAIIKIAQECVQRAESTVESARHRDGKRLHSRNPAARHARKRGHRMGHLRPCA